MESPHPPHQLTQLVQHFASQQASNDWNEAETREEFINPLFECLDWDVSNKKNLANNFKEVRHETSLKIGSNMKAPDYSFNHGRALFYLEAKKPNVDIKEDIDSAFQLRRYGWTAKMPISILTNFRGLAIYDCRFKPHKNDPASTARICYYDYRDLVDKWQEIYDFVSREAVLIGSLNDFENKQLKGTASIDEDFLKAIENWREHLTFELATKNKNLDEKQLNFAIQKIIDRIIFLRITEDRGIETYGELKRISGQRAIYPALVQLFKKADDKYNSGLFHFKTETGRTESPDAITPHLKIEDRVLREIIKGLYYPDSPYEFSVIAGDILGSVYERFLGKVIEKKPDSIRAKIVSKPAIRKAGGVYYTPNAIVNYIISGTLEEWLADKKPAAASKLKLLDPACGSGSFLLEAYQFLLDWHLKYYSDESKKYVRGREPKIFESKRGLQLTLAERKRILLNNIYGVDVDRNAVEVTKLSLLLKVLEYEGQEVSQYSIIKERILPDLYENIKCGNSLISSADITDGFLSNVFTDDELYKINPFDWKDKKRGFGDIIQGGGFDVVVGNPPYLKEYTDTYQFNLIKQSKLKSYYQGKMDLWYLFACQSIDLLKENGLHGFIATNNWITSAGSSILRNKILLETQLKKFLDFADFKVFQSASIQTMIYILEKNKKENHQVDYLKILDKNIVPEDLFHYINADVGKKKKLKIERFKTTLNRKKHLNKTFSFVSKKIEAVLNKIKANANYYLKEEDIAQGIVPNPDFLSSKHLGLLKDKSLKVSDGVFVINEKQFDLIEKEKKYLKNYYTNINRYFLPKRNYKIIYLTRKNSNNINDFPNFKNHLQKYKAIMLKRRETKNKSIKWFQLHWPRDERFFVGDKILSLRKTTYPQFCFSNTQDYVSLAANSIKPKNINLKYLTALLNSKVVYFWLYHQGKKQGDQLQIDKAPLLEIPLVKTDDKEVENKIVKLVDKMMTLKKQIQVTKLDHDKKLLEGQVQVVDERMEELVRGVYGVSVGEMV